MNVHARETLNSVVIPTIAAGTFLAGAVVFVANVVHHSIPRIIQEGFGGQIRTESIWTDFLYSSSPVFFVIALITGIWTVFTLPQRPNEAADTKMNAEMFSSHLIGLGYFLLVDAILTVVALACFAATGQLDEVLKPAVDFAATVSGTTPAPGPAPAVLDEIGQRRGFVTQAIILGLSLAMAILGALFYFANSLWTKFAAKTEMFNQNVFWAGLWFRLAEAVVFTLAFFLALRFDPDTLYLMPMIGLFIGMTVKSAEALVFGLAERTLAAAIALVSPPEKKAPAPANPAGIQNPPNPNGNPPSGGTPMQIAVRPAQPVASPQANGDIVAPSR